MKTKLLIVVLLTVVHTLPAMAADRFYFGMAPKGARLEALAVRGSSALPTVLLIGGLDGNTQTARLIDEEVRTFEALSEERRTFQLLAVPMANPENSPLVFPPTGKAYSENPESHALWRWIGLQAPDLVIIAGSSTAGAEDFGLESALSQSAVAGVGRVPARRMPARPGMLQAVTGNGIAPSEARLEIARRLARSPRQLAEELAQFYGHEFNDLTYIPGMSLIGRLRLGQVTDIQSLVAQWVDGPRAAAPGGRPASGNLAGYLVFAELAQVTGDARYTEMVRTAAGVGFTETGEMRESMGASNQMSDGVFMSMPILGKAAKLTGESRYCEMAARHLKFMQDMDLRADGLYRHSPTSENVAWGRGNAFPALGVAMTLSDCAKDHPQFENILQEYKKHITALTPFQSQDGLWHQVIDEPGSYSEFTATAMIGVAMLRGIRHGWLDAAEYQPRVDKAWRAILKRVGPEGQLIDVCESTNKQATLRDYLHREAIFGYDIRGGGMALLFATEMAGLTN